MIEVKPDKSVWWRGQYGRYEYPDEIIAEAEAMSPGKRFLFDGRTKGYKFLKVCGEHTDEKTYSLIKDYMRPVN